MTPTQERIQRTQATLDAFRAAREGKKITHTAHSSRPIPRPLRSWIVTTTGPDGEVDTYTTAPDIQTALEHASPAEIIGIQRLDV